MSFMQPARTIPAVGIFPKSSERSTAHETLPGLDTSFFEIVERALNYTRASGAALAMLQDHDMICVASAGSDAPPVGSRVQTESGFSGRCVRMRHLLRCDDAESDPRVHRETCRALDIRSIVAAPIVENELVTGVLEVFSPAPNTFTAADEAFLELLAKNVPGALSRNPSFLQRDHLSSKDDQRNSNPSLPTDLGCEVVKSKQSFFAKFYRVTLGFACAVIAVASLLMVSRMRTWFATPPPIRNDVQTAVQHPNAPASALFGASDLFATSKLAEQGDPAAQFALGARYATGEDVPQDYSQAVLWFSKAAEQGHVLAQATLGAYYWAGRGVPSDLNKAYFWSILAQMGGDQASEYRVSILNSRLTSSQILAIKQEANDWLTRHRQPTQGQLSTH